jgi:hypothetical protein
MTAILKLTLKTLLATLLAGGVAAEPAFAGTQGEHPAADTRDDRPLPKPTPKPAVKRQTFAAWHERSGKRFERSWGADIVGVRRVASGSMLRFDYKVVDPTRAAALTDRKARPYLIDEATRTALAVPAMENVGELRQVAPLELNRTYYVLFGNPGGLVKRGGRVTLVIGNLRAEGLVVE